MKPMGESNDQKIDVDLLGGKRPDSLWNRLWDILLQPTESMSPDIGQQIVKQPVNQPVSDRNFNRRKSKGKSPPANQLSLFTLDKTAPERNDTGPQEEEV